MHVRMHVCMHTHCDGVLFCQCQTGIDIIAYHLTIQLKLSKKTPKTVLLLPVAHDVQLPGW